MHKTIVMCCRDGEFDKPRIFDTHEKAYDFMKQEYRTQLDSVYRRNES